MNNLILLSHAAATLAMVGVVWFVQVVHYPLFTRVGRGEFRRYEIDHQRLTTFVVGPLMLIELATGLLLAFRLGGGPLQIAAWGGLALLAAIWTMTYLLQIPQHAALIIDYNPATIRNLVRGNWARTIAWTARGLVVLWIVSQVIVMPEADLGSKLAFNPL
ncbi:MAG: hypothetical protein AAGA92_15640 [Planctomycetota bacterium]